jgi:hypothetical protein
VDLELSDTLAAVKNSSAPSFSPDLTKWVFRQWSLEHDRSSVLSILNLSVADSITVLLPRVGIVEYEWAPDSQSLVAYGHPRTEGHVSVWIIPVDLSPPTEVTFNEVVLDYEFAWSPTGRWLAIVCPADSDLPDPNTGFLLLHDTHTDNQYSPADSIVSSLYDHPIWTSDSSVACVDVVRGGYFEVLINRSPDVEP